MAWFQSLELMEQIFAICAIPATILLVLQTVLMLFGLGSVGVPDMSSDTSGIGDGGGYNIFGDGDAEAIDATHDAGFRLFTVRGLVTFFALFGWTGLVCLQAEFPFTASLIIAFFAGAVGMAITAWIMKSMLKLQSDGSLNLTNALGKTATVYIRVPSKRSNRGKVSLVIQERLIEMNAVTDEEFDLSVGSEVAVIGMSSGDTLIVAAKNPR